MNVDVWQCALHPASHVVGRRLDDTFFLLNLDNNAVFELNATGTEIWLWIEEKHSLQGCLDHLSAQFAVEAALLREEVGALVEMLVQEGLVESSADTRMSEVGT